MNNNINIGILTFYRVANFGANLQALSTYRYIENAELRPVMIYYVARCDFESIEKKKDIDIQTKNHLFFCEKHFKFQTRVCHSIEDVNRVLSEYNIKKVIVGSDAVLQHHPFISRIHKGNIRPIYLEKVSPDRMYPNIFWGCGWDKDVKLALMSASSQNSDYKWFGKKLKEEMFMSIKRYSYVSVRDEWTKNMLSVIGIDSKITPDPVFSFNKNVGDLIPSKTEILEKFQLPEHYILISLMSQSVSFEQLGELQRSFKKYNYECVSLPMPTGTGFKHPFAYSIEEPLDPLDWYALIKYANGYVGSNMHPIIVSLHNAVPCYSIDFWGLRNFWNKPKKDGSSKVKDILIKFGLEDYYSQICNGKCRIDPDMIVNKIITYPKMQIKEKAKEMLTQYDIMMQDIFKALES